MSIYKCIELYENNTEDPRLYRIRASIEGILELKEILKKNSKKLYIDDIENRDNIEYSIVQDKLEFIEQHIRSISSSIVVIRPYIEFKLYSIRLIIDIYSKNDKYTYLIDSYENGYVQCYIAKNRRYAGEYINNSNIIDHIDSVNRAMEECFILT